MAFAKDDAPHLIEFDGVQFHPELKGMPDAERGDRIFRGVSMGGMQQMSDPFLAHAYRVLFGNRVPTIERAKLVVAWTVDHVIRYNYGGVGGKHQLAVLEKVAGTWSAHHIDTGQVLQQVKDLEDHVSSFLEKAYQEGDAAIDPHAALAPEADKNPEEKS